MRKIGFEMRKIARLLAVLAATLAPALHGAPADAQSSPQSWVSHSGSDNNNCSLALPCATFVQALSQTENGGQVFCLDAGSFGEFAVTTSVTIDCSGTVAVAKYEGAIFCAQAISINAPGKVVTLRGLRIAGATLQNICTIANGIVIQAAAAVNIEDCVIEDFSQKGSTSARPG
jgi:hypothetical protein